MIRNVSIMQLQIVASRKDDAFDLVFAAESGTANQ